jgi:hypothetical protein
MSLHTIASQHGLSLHDLLTDELPDRFGDAGLAVESDVERCGGTTEAYYPPQAYETRRIAGIRHFTIRSHAAGRSSSKDWPLLIALATDRQEGFFCGLEWSAHWSGEARTTAEQFRLTVTISVAGMVLALGETLELPAVHLGFFRGDLADGTNVSRRYLAEQVCPPAKALVSYDTWFGLENNYTADILKGQVDRAAPGSAAAREHPEVFIEAPPGFSFGGVGGRQPHLNLARRHARDWVIETMGRWITQRDLRWSRFDYNLEPDNYWRAVDPTMRISFADMAGLYRVLDVLLQRPPKWQVEACASGGRRIDIGTLRRAARAGSRLRRARRSRPTC